jgi:hypothetical protein
LAMPTTTPWPQVSRHAQMESSTGSPGLSERRWPRRCSIRGGVRLPDRPHSSLDCWLNDYEHRHNDWPSSVLLITAATAVPVRKLGHSTVPRHGRWAVPGSCQNRAQTVRCSCRRHSPSSPAVTLLALDYQMARLGAALLLPSLKSGGAVILNRVLASKCQRL